MKINELNKFIEETLINEVKNAILNEGEAIEVYHLKCDGEPIGTYKTKEEAESEKEKIKGLKPGQELIIDKTTYESYGDMLEKLDAMGEELEETNDMKKNTEKLNEGLTPRGVEKVQQWCDSLGCRQAGNKLIDVILNKIAGVTSSDLADTATFANGLDEIEVLLEDGDYESAYEMAKDVANDMLSDEGFPMDMDEDGEANEGNEFTGALNKAKEEGKDKFTVDGKEYDVKEGFGPDDEESFEPTGEDDYLDSAYEDKTHLPDEESMTPFDDMDDESMDDENFGDDYENLPDGQEDEMDESAMGTCNECGAMLNEEGLCAECNTMKESDKSTCNECGSMLNEEGLCTECGTMKESKKVLRLKESEMIGLIKKIVTEAMQGNPGTKGIPGLTTAMKSKKGSGNESGQYLKDVKKKMQDYLSIDGNDNPEFPNAIGKGEKAAVNLTSKEEEEVAKNKAGLQNLDYDMEPSEKFKERLKMAIEGDSKMGNADTTQKPSIAPSNGADKGKEAKESIGNVINSKKAKEKLNKQITDRAEEKENRVLYDKQPVPVKNKVNESKEDAPILNEELRRMMNLSSYNKKTQ